jgi:hypothetical protein
MGACACTLLLEAKALANPLAIWGYALIWFLFNDVVKIWVYGLMQHGVDAHSRHLWRVDTPLNPGPF